MSKEVLVLGLEGDELRGVRLAESGKEWVRHAVESWPLSKAADVSTDEAAPAAEDAAASEIVEDDQPLVRAFRGAVKKFGAREFILSVPLSRLLVSVVRLPADMRDDLAGAAALELDRFSPFPDEILRPGCEIVAETDTEITVLVAALPEAAASAVSAALDVAGVRITRTDATALGWLRSLWPKITEKTGASRRLVLLNLDDGWDILVLDDEALSAVRGLGTVSGPDELVREVTLSLLQNEWQRGGREIDDVVICARGAVAPALSEQLGVFGPVRTLSVEDSFAGVEGVARRETEQTLFDVTPGDWVEARAESRFKRHLTIGLSVAAGVWFLILLFLLSGPFVYGQMTAREKALSKSHQRAFRDVKEMRDRVKLVQRYSDHARGSLEMLRMVSDCLPEGVTLTSFQYRRGIDLRVKGEAEERDTVYTFKDAFEALRKEGTFTAVNMTGPSLSRGLHRFEIVASFEEQEEK